MRVTSGATWSTSLGEKRSYSVECDPSDLSAIGIKVDTLKATQLHMLLGNRADQLVTAYLAQEGAISNEYAAARLGELLAKFKEVLGK